MPLPSSQIQQHVKDFLTQELNDNRGINLDRMDL
jgi:hypothetical protein